MTKKMFLDDLPLWCDSGNKGKINWTKCVGYKVEFIYGDTKGEIEIVDYNVKTSKLTVKYNDTLKYMDTDSFKKGTIGELLNKHTSKFKIALGTLFDNEDINFVITDRYHKINNQGYDKKYYKYTCNKCGWTEGEIDETRLLQEKTGCSCCCNKVAVLGINTIWDTDRWMCDLGVSEEDAKGYTKSSGKKINVKCPDCGREKCITISKIYTYKSISCSCGDGRSYPEKFIRAFLEQLSVKYESEYSPEYLTLNGSKKRSDFFINSNKVIVEVDGEIGHIGGKTHAKSNKTLDELIAIDKWKDEQHALHGIKTIRINCFQSNMGYIKNSILNSELVNYFDLSNIDWLECEKFALKNIVKEVCDYWNQKEEWETTKDLISIFNISRFTIINYLKIGNDRNWCVYSPKEEHRKGTLKHINEKKIIVEMFKDKVSLGVFESAYDLEKKSEELFGIKLYSGSIGEVCKNKKKSYKGYTFKYINYEKNNKVRN